MGPEPPPYRGSAGGIPGGEGEPVGICELKMPRDLPQSTPTSQSPPLRLDLVALQSRGPTVGVLTRVGWGQPLAPLPAAWPARAKAGKASRSSPKSKVFCLIYKSAKEAKVFAELWAKMGPSQVLKIGSLDLSRCPCGRSGGHGQTNQQCSCTPLAAALTLGSPARSIGLAPL